MCFQSGFKSADKSHKCKCLQGRSSEGSGGQIGLRALDLIVGGEVGRSALDLMVGGEVGRLGQIAESQRRRSVDVNKMV